MKLTRHKQAKMNHRAKRKRREANIERVECHSGNYVRKLRPRSKKEVWEDRKPIEGEEANG